MRVNPPADIDADRRPLRILQFGAVAVVLAATPYKPFDLDRYFVPKELVLLFCAALASLLVAVRLARVSLTVVDSAMVLFLVSSLVSAIVATNPWAAERALAISAGGAALFWCASSLRRAGLARPLLARSRPPSWSALSRRSRRRTACGASTSVSTARPAGRSAIGTSSRTCARSACPSIVLVAVTARRPATVAIGVAGSVAVAAALVMSRSRAAWLAVIVSIGAVVVTGAMSRGQWRGTRTLPRLSSSASRLSSARSARSSCPTVSSGRATSPYLDSAAGLVNYKEGSGRGRLVQYTNSLQMTEAHPLLGVGPGNWPVVYPKYASRNDPSIAQDEGMTSNPWPSSDWVAYLSERGAIGLAALIVVLVGLLRRAYMDVRSTQPRTRWRTRSTC